MAKGLDVGTLNIICGEKQGNSTIFAQQKNAYLEIDDKDLTGGMFDTGRLLSMEKNGKTLILGEDAVKLANILRREIKRTVKYGLITREDKESIPLLRLIVEKVVSRANDNEILCISSPARPIDSDIDVDYHKKTLRAMAKKWGYDVTEIDEGLAVIYSELGKHSFTGVGISLGAGYTSVTVAHRAKIIVSFSLAKGGDWIEKETAAATGATKQKINSIKEDKFSLDSEFEMGSVKGALSIYYEALVNYIINNLRKELGEVKLPQVEFPVVVSGGVSLTKGFVELFKDKLSEAGLPLKISSVDRAKEPIYTVARGCLISALTRESAATRSKTETKAEAKHETDTDVETEWIRPKREPKRIRIPPKTKEPEKTLARSMANKPCVSSDGVVVGTVHNLTVDWNTGSLKDLWVKPSSSSFLRLNTYSGLYVIPFENVRSTEEYIVIKTLKVE